MKARRLGTLLLTLATYGLLVLFGVLFVLPFVWMVLSSLKSAGELLRVPPTFLPADPRWENYGRVLQTVPFVQFYLNSTIMTTGRVLGQLLLCSLAGFAFARLRFPGRDGLFIALLISLMVPAATTLVPNFIIVRQLRWVDTFQGLIVPTLFSAFGTFMLRQYFLTVPRDYQDAAVIDGANPLQIYWHIFLPLARPALAAFGLLVALWSWNDFLWPLIVSNRTDTQVLSVGIALFSNRAGTDTPLMMAAATMSIVPMLVIFFAVQRHLVEGIALGGIKN
ncbi:MAG: sugar ABC transporter permease [Chloroflexota bacterium]